MYRIRSCMIFLLPLIFILCGAGSSRAGMEARYWPIQGTLLDFGTSTGTPVKSLLKPSLSGYSSVCLSDAAGNLLLYGDYKHLYDKTGEAINTLPMNGNSGLNQGCVLVPKPGAPGHYCMVYIVFSTDPSTNRTLCYTEVALDSTGAEIIEQNEPIANTLHSVALTVTATPDRTGYYIVAKTDTGEAMGFQVIKLTRDGFKVMDASVPASDPNQEFGNFSNFKFNVDGTRIAYDYTKDHKAYVPIHAFDPLTGDIALQKEIRVTNEKGRLTMGGVEFSPNGRYLYSGLVKGGQPYLLQIDIATGTCTDITPDDMSGDSSIMIGCLQLAMNGDIYATISKSKHLLHIKKVDLEAGKGCESAMEELLNDGVAPGLPVFVTSYLRRNPVELEPGETIGVFTATLKPGNLPAGVTAEAYGVCWGTDPEPVPAMGNTKTATTGEKASFDLKEALPPGTACHVRGFVRGSDGTVYYGDSSTVNLPAPPVISALAFTAGDNSGGLELKIMGTGFLEPKGANIVRFENARRAFNMASKAGTATELFVEIPAGAPAGVYKVRVINTKGVSPAAATPFTLTEAPTPPPVVTGVSPIVLPTDRLTRVTLTGEHFNDVADGNLIAPDGTETPFGIVKTLGSTTVEAEIDVPEGFAEGQYIVQVINRDGSRNEVSAVRVEIYKPVDLSLGSGPMTTTHMVKPLGGKIPVRTTLVTDDRNEVDVVTRSRAKISVTFDAGTILEEQDDGEAWNDYEGLVNPPRQVPLTETVEESLGTDSVLFTMGAEGFLRLKDGGTLYAEIEVPMPEGAPVPSVYYVAPDGSITLAGVDGTRNGLAIAPGGTVLATRRDVPEAGFVTYTVGLLLNHMSTYAAGTKSEIDDPGSDEPSGGGSYGPCFIGASHGGSQGFSLFVFFLFTIVSAGGLMVKRFTGFITLMAVVFVMASPQAGGAGELPGNADGAVAACSEHSPWSLTAGVSAGYIGESYRAAAGGTAYDLDVDTVVSPVLRVDYAFSNHLSLEAKAALDLYSGEMDALTADGASSVRGYTLGLGPVWYLAEGSASGVGSWRPFVHAGVTYRDLKGGLRYAVTDFDPAFGAELGAGVRFQNLEVRMSYNHSVFDEGGRGVGVNASDGDLDLSFVALEVAWIVPLHR